MNDATPFETLQDFRIELNNRIFVNRTLNLNSIQVLGFDMDYTLVLYNEAELEAQAFECAVELLIGQRGYPCDIRRLRFAQEKIMRGLVIDKKLGNLVKVNRFGYIKAALHGERLYTLEEQKRIYADEIVSLSSPRYEMVHTFFSLAHCSLYCQLVDRPDLPRSYEELYDDIRGAMDEIHRNGSLKQRIMRDPARYVRLDRGYAETLKMFQAAGKKLALITNSEWEFTQAMMSFCYDRFLPEGASWRDLFSLVIVDAAKPGFFSGSAKFFEVLPESGHLKNLQGRLREGGVYQGGSSAQVEELFGVSPGEILYVGDHVYSDVYQSKKNCRWRTMLVITELEAELQAAAQGREHLGGIARLMEEKESLELQLGQISKKRASGFTLVKALQDMPDEKLGAIAAQAKERILALDREIGALIGAYNAKFNPYWGELMWAGNDKSHFGMIIERFACVYGSKVSNLLYYSPGHYFRPPIKGI